MSDLSTYSPEVPAFWQMSAKMAGDTVRQVQKDFALHGVALTFSHANLESYRGLVQVLGEELEKNKFLESSKFAGIIYQLDLKESNLAVGLRSAEPQFIYFFLADKILKRCFEKVYWRYKMKENR